MTTKTERLALDSLIDTSPSSERELESIAGRIMQGAVFIYPTETIYGIGALGSLAESRNRIVAAKRREPENSMILLASERKAFENLPISFPRSARILAQLFWPGNLTLVLPSTTDSRGIGVRTSDHPFIAALFRYLHEPVFSTSANISGEPYVNDPDAIFSCFDGNVDFMIDAGTLPRSAPSTVVRVSAANDVHVMREGVIPTETIFAALESSAPKPQRSFFHR